MPAAPILHLVVNPSAGRGRARRLLPKVHNTLARSLGEGQVVVHLSSSFDDALERSRAAALACRPAEDGGRADALVVMGGDGMAHVGLNACAEAVLQGVDVPLGIIPAGTGNDFCRGVGIAPSVREATLAVAGGHTRRTDLTEVRLADGSRRFVGSVVSTGYDARVTLAANQVRVPLGPLAYGMVALRELAAFRPCHYRLEIDGAPRELDSVLVAVANAGFFGGGMHIVPPARPDDGLLDVLLVGPLARHEVLGLLPRLYRGSHVDHPAVEFVRASQVRVDGAVVLRDGSRDTMYAMADGELLGDVPALARCRPGLVRIFRP